MQFAVPGSENGPAAVPCELDEAYDCIVVMLLQGMAEEVKMHVKRFRI